MSNIEINPFDEHQHAPSVFIMFTADFKVIWCYSGNELRRLYLENPGDYISEPLEVPIPPYLDKRLTAFYEDFSREVKPALPSAAKEEIAVVPRVVPVTIITRNRTILHRRQRRSFQVNSWLICCWDVAAQILLLS